MRRSKNVGNVRGLRDRVKGAVRAFLATERNVDIEGQVPLGRDQVEKPAAQETPPILANGQNRNLTLPITLECGTGPK